jgi:calcineurin-like phosphoesterase family protein
MLKPPFYVVSDTHFFHHNIIKYCGRDANHNAIMVKRWNSVVGPRDTVLHLGDVCFTRDPAKRQRFFEQVGPSLNGKVFVILGNHDDAKDVPRFEAIGWTVIRPFNMVYNGFEVSFDHYPTAKGLIAKGEHHIRVHGHIHNNGYQHVRTKRKEHKRYGNVNVSVEVIDYTPQPIERLLDKAIEEMKHRQRYVNVNSKRDGRSQDLRAA